VLRHRVILRDRYSGILHSGEGEDVEQVCSNLETNLTCLRLLISLSLSHTHTHTHTLVFISCMRILFVLIYFMFDIPCA